MFYGLFPQTFISLFYFSSFMVDLERRALDLADGMGSYFDSVHMDPEGIARSFSIIDTPCVGLTRFLRGKNLISDKDFAGAIGSFDAKYPSSLHRLFVAPSPFKGDLPLYEQVRFLSPKVTTRVNHVIYKAFRFAGLLDSLPSVWAPLSIIDAWFTMRSHVPHEGPEYYDSIIQVGDERGVFKLVRPAWPGSSFEVYRS